MAIWAARHGTTRARRNMGTMRYGTVRHEGTSCRAWAALHASARARARHASLMVVPCQHEARRRPTMPVPARGRGSALRSPSRSRWPPPKRRRKLALCYLAVARALPSSAVANSTSSRHGCWRSRRRRGGRDGRSGGWRRRPWRRGVKRSSLEGDGGLGKCGLGSRCWGYKMGLLGPSCSCRSMGLIGPLIFVLCWAGTTCLRGSPGTARRMGRAGTSPKAAVLGRVWTVPNFRAVGRPMGLLPLWPSISDTTPPTHLPS